MVTTDSLDQTVSFLRRMHDRISASLQHFLREVDSALREPAADTQPPSWEHSEYVGVRIATLLRREDSRSRSHPAVLLALASQPLPLRRPRHALLRVPGGLPQVRPRPARAEPLRQAAAAGASS